MPLKMRGMRPTYRRRETRSTWHVRADALLQVCRDAAREAAGFVAEQSRRLAELNWQSKSRVDFVSAVDTGAEERIRDRIHARFPDAAIIGEELSPDETATAGVVFVVDPLDGTTNFLHGYPQYAVSIAALIDGVLEAAVVHDVSRDVCFSARRGGGAWRDDRQVQVSTIDVPARALIGTGFPFRDPSQLQPYLDGFFGAAALDLADVACGRFDAFWELSLSSWDVAAGILLIREAGGLVTDVHGAEKAVAHGSLVAGNPVMHRWLLQRLQSSS
jgi:myo-inositol-1(or 4)-monophosphatase